MAKIVKRKIGVVLSKEAAKQHDIVRNEMCKLADLSGISWGLLTRSSYRQDMARSALIGAGSVAAAIGLTKLVKNIRKNHKAKQEPESE